MQLLDLNDDALLGIGALLLLKDLSRLSRTCHRLHDLICIHLLLKDDIWLTRGRLASFYKFMQVESGGNHARARALRSLAFNFFPDLKPPIPKANSAQAFSDLLRTCGKNLTSLSIYSHVGLVFTPGHLRLALSWLPNLRSLVLDGITEEYQDALADAPPDLQSVFLLMNGPTRDIDEKFYPLDPLPFLQYHHSSLHSVTLIQVGLDTRGTPFPAVRDLKVTNFCVNDWKTGLIGPLVHLFPHVKHVELWSLRTHTDSYTHAYHENWNDSALAIVNEIRTNGKLWQAEHGTWAHGLQYLNVESFLDVYILGLSCHVDRIDVCSTFPSSVVTAGALADATPRCLSLGIEGIRELKEEFTDLLHAIAQIRSVTHLLIGISDGLLPSMAFARMGEMLRGTPVMYLYIHVDELCIPDRRIHDENTDDKVNPGITGKLTLEAYEYPDAALQLLTRYNPSLRRVFFDFTKHGLKAWERVSTDREERARWEIMEESHTRGVLVAEDMIWKV
ncbi:hypothetical protein GY45DRAFT_1287052 [Cubamyces sp. BRFM 1775]|nr:hypothetical protein GY45DRAFT_1287052 [Cubamyces sp. BRFM 1775]